MVIIKVDVLSYTLFSVFDMTLRTLEILVSRCLAAWAHLEAVELDLTLFDVSAVARWRHRELLSGTL